eukprot:gene19059-24112_t
MADNAMLVLMSAHTPDYAKLEAFALELAAAAAAAALPLFRLKGLGEDNKLAHL